MSAGALLWLRAGALGDGICSLYGLRALREAWPRWQMSWVGHAAVGELALAAGLVDGAEVLDQGAWAPLWREGAQGLSAAMRRRLQQTQALVLQLADEGGCLERQLLALLPSGARCLRLPHAPMSGAGPACLQLAQGLQAWLPAQGAGLWEGMQRPLLAAGGCAAVGAVEGRLVAIHPGSGSLQKNWPVEGWLEVAAWLGARGFEAVWVLGEAELERGTLPSAVAGRRWQALPMRELIQRLSGCAMFLGHDSGLGHLAGALGLPGLLLFGPSEAGVWAPPAFAAGRLRLLQAPQGQWALLPPSGVLVALEEALAALPAGAPVRNRT
jgi:heptosyltransferase-3